MKLEATWSKIGEAIYNADAQKVAEEIESIGSDVKPAQIVEKARDSSTELHKCFTWDNDEAAEKWRLHQARHITGCLVIRRTEEVENVPEIRYFHMTDSRGYRPAQYVFTHADEHQKLLQAAYADLQIFKRKYESLQELDYILSLIE